MPDRTPSPPWREILPGLGVLVALAAAALLIFLMDDIRRAFTEGPTLVLSTSYAPELGAGNELWIAGRRAGRVRAVRLGPPDAPPHGGILIEAVLRRDAARHLRRDASARIERSGLMGPAVVNIRPGTPAEPPFDYSDTLRAPGPPAQERLLAALDSLARALDEARPLARRLAGELEDGPGTLPALRRDPEAVSAFTEQVRRALRLRREAERRSLGLLLQDTAWSEALRRSGERLRRLELSVAEREAARGTPTLAEATARLGERVREMEAHLEAGGGTAGRALNDDELARQLALLRARTDSVRAALVSDPLRWLRWRLF